jgi:hypothetical protein
MCKTLRRWVGRVSWQRRVADENRERGAALERAYGIAKGATPRRENPIGGVEMKQARQAVGGVKASRGYETLRTQRNRAIGFVRARSLPTTDKTS